MDQAAKAAFFLAVRSEAQCIKKNLFHSLICIELISKFMPRKNLILSSEYSERF